MITMKNFLRQLDALSLNAAINACKKVPEFLLVDLSGGRKSDLTPPIFPPKVVEEGNFSYFRKFQVGEI